MKYYYEEEFCGHYRQLMPVIYEINENGQYCKTGMACENKNSTCSLEECKHFFKAPDQLDVSDLRENKIGQN